METKDTKVIACRVPRRLAELIEKLCAIDMHLNPADFLRDAIREKIQREYPEYKKLLMEAERK